MYENLIEPWAEVACLPMMDDGQITWYAGSGSFPMQKAINKLTKKVDLVFVRVDNEADAEIILTKKRKLDDPSWLGVARWGEATGYKWELEVLRGKEYRSTVTHELGHALGLGHPEDHYGNTDTIMSYARYRKNWRFRKQDIVNIEEIYFPDNNNIVTRPFDVFDNDTLPNINHITPKKFKKNVRFNEHKHNVHELDYLTGLTITSTM